MENSKNNIKYLSIQDIADSLGFSYNKVYKLIVNREIPAMQIGSQYRVDKEDFNEYLFNQRLKKKEKKSIKQIYKKKPVYDNPWGVPLR